MLHRLRMGGKTGHESFTKYSLSRRLKSRIFASEGTKANIIYADDFCKFERAVITKKVISASLMRIAQSDRPPVQADPLPHNARRRESGWFRHEYIHGLADRLQS